MISEITSPLRKFKSPFSKEILTFSVLPSVKESPSVLNGTKSKSNCITPLTSIGLIFTEFNFCKTSLMLNEATPDSDNLPNDALEFLLPA